MAEAIRIHAHGGPDVLGLEAVDVAAPGPGEARVRHVAVGLNFADPTSAPACIRPSCRPVSGSRRAASSKRSAPM